MEVTPAWFPISSQKIGGEPELLHREVEQTSLFFMSNQIILHHHLGLGDHFICCGLVNSLSEQYQKIYLACKERNYETVKCLYSENPKIEILKIISDEHREVYSYSNTLNLPVIRVGFGPLEVKDFHIKFYEMVNVDFENRYSKFNLPKKIEGVDELYQKVVGDNKDYILVHSGSSEQDEYYMDIFGWRDGETSQLPIIKITDKITKNLLQWIKVIENAKEIHVTPSSVFFLVDSIQNNLNSDLYYHSVRPVAETFPPNNDYNQYRWNIVEYENYLVVLILQPLHNEETIFYCHIDELGTSL